MQRRKFSREFKLEAVRLVKERGVSVAQAARDLDLHENELRKWVRDLSADPQHAFPGHGQMKPEQIEIDRLRKEVAKLKAERDILKEPQPTLQRTRYEVRLHCKAPFDLAVGMALRSAGCLAFGLSCLAHPGSQVAARRDAPRRDRSKLQEQRPHLWRTPHLARCPRRRLRLRSAPRRTADAGERPAGATTPAWATDGHGRACSGIANLLNRAFEAAAPNRKWVADFTYLWTAEEWLYVAAVIVLLSRRVVGWAMKAEMTAQLVTDALIMAIWRRGRPDSLMHHSDQGSQYTSGQFQRLMADHGITCSMSRSGNVWDNAAMESFFSSLKTERTARKVYRTRDDARADVFDYIERFYNPRRRHSTLGYLSPVEFEERAMLA